MIKIQRSACPAALSDAIAKAEKEEIRNTFLAHTGKVLPEKLPSPFRRYAAAEVKELLKKDFKEKCAYCETRYAVSSYLNVEHFRPKKGVSHNKQMLTGYWWLALEWSNLLPACTQCNSVYKGNKFPLKNGATPAQHEGCQNSETPLLIDPTRVDPARHLYWDVKNAFGTVHGKTEEGRTSIDTYGLNRFSLIKQRTEVMRKAVIHCETILALSKALNSIEHPGAQREIRNVIRMHMEELHSMSHPVNEYSALATAVIEHLSTAISAAQASLMASKASDHGESTAA